MTRTIALLLLTWLAAGCAALSNDPDAVGNARRGTITRHLDLAEAEIEAGELDDALDRLLDVRTVDGQSPEERQRIDALFERCVTDILDELAGEGFDADDLLALYELDLTPRLRAYAGVLAAQRLFEEGHPVKSYRLIKKIEREFPSHQQRALAGEVLATTALWMARNGGRYYFLFRYRARGMEALEFLVLTYPFDERCAEAYDVLASNYEAAGRLELAIQRYEDLLVYHPRSPYAVAAEARIPVLRLDRIQRSSYDRSEFLRARGELERWLQRHAGHELEGWVREALARSGRQLARSDLGLADYYLEVGNDFGARQHATRALATAREAGAADEAAEAAAILAQLGDGDGASEPALGPVRAGSAPR